MNTTNAARPAAAEGGTIAWFFLSADKFKARDATVGFNEDANLDGGAMAPIAFAPKQPTAAGGEAKIAALVTKPAR